MELMEENTMTDEERQKAAEWFRNRAKNITMTASRKMYEMAAEALEEPKQKDTRIRMTNAEMKDFLAHQFDISRNSASEMLHEMMRVKAEDTFKKRFNGGEHHEN